MPNSYRVGGPSGRSSRVHGSLASINNKSTVNSQHRNSIQPSNNTTSNAAIKTTTATTALPYNFDDMPLVDTSDFCHLMLRTLASRMVARATPFTHLTSTSTQVLAELLALKLGQLARTVKLAAEMAGRTQATLKDVAIALDRVGTGQAGYNVDSESGYGGAINRDQGELRRWCLSETETSVKAIGGNAITVLHQLVQSGRVPPAPPYLIYEYKSESDIMNEEDEDIDVESYVNMDVDVDTDVPVTLAVDNTSDQLPFYIPHHLPPLPSHDTTIEPSTHIPVTNTTVSTSTGVTTLTSIQTTETSLNNVKTTLPEINHQTTPKSKRKRSRHPNAEQADQLALAALHSNDTATFMARTIFNPSSINTKHQFLAYEVPDTNIDDFIHINYPGLFAVEDKPRISVKHIKQPAPPPPGSTVTGPQLSLLTTQKHINAAPMDTLFGPCELGKVPSVSDTVQHLMQPAVVERIITNNHTIRGRTLPPPLSATTTTITPSETALVTKIPAISASTVLPSTSTVTTPSTPTPISVKVKSAQLSKKLAEATEDKSTKKTTATTSAKSAPSVVNVVLPSKTVSNHSLTSSSSKVVVVEKSRDTSKKLSISTTTQSATSTPLSPTIKLKPIPSSSTTLDSRSTSSTSVPLPSLQASTPTTPNTGLPKIRLKIGKISIGLPQASPSPTTPLPPIKTSVPTVTPVPLVDTSVTTSNEPEEIINCICDAPAIDHGRFMIACDQCATWFHGECVRVGPDTVPDGTEWYCPRCSAIKKS